jgi:patatin-like phospholipase/acyl hydrolase
MSTERFQILSLDGGGLKGAFTAFFLARLEEDLGVHVADHFDLIVGTSTGGIIALGLGMNLSPAEIFEFYQAEGRHIFPSGRLRAVRRFFRAKFHNAELERALKLRFGQRVLGDSSKRLVIPSYELRGDSPYLFKTPHHARFRRDCKVEAWKVAMATSAAPTYLPAYTGIDGHRLIDGGVWANDPVMLGVTEAVSILGAQLGAISILSLGTTSEIVRRLEGLDRGGMLRWGRAAIEVALVGQSKGAINQAGHLVGKENVLRLDHLVPAGLFALDQSDFAGLASHAATCARHLLPEIGRRFLDHQAPRFTPQHTSDLVASA